MERLRSFWSARVHTVSATLNVKVNVVYVPFLSIDYIVNRLQYDSVRQQFAGWLKVAVTRNITSSMQMARRKTWPEDVAKRCHRKAWLKGVVLGRACRNRGRELSWLPVVSARSFGVQLHDNDPACIKATQGISSCA